jgi:hypothetical protein
MATVVPLRSSRLYPSLGIDILILAEERKVIKDAERSAAQQHRNRSASFIPLPLGEDDACAVTLRDLYNYLNERMYV